MASPPPVQPTNDQLEYSLKFRKIDAIVMVLTQGIKWGCLLVIVHYGYLSIVALAGKQTVASVLLHLLANVRVSNSLAYLFGAGGILYGVGQRQLRRRNIRRTVRNKNELERIIHPGRTSSNITEIGTTRPGDKL